MQVILLLFLNLAVIHYLYLLLFLDNFNFGKLCSKAAMAMSIKVLLASKHYFDSKQHPR